MRKAAAVARAAVGRASRAVVEGGAEIGELRYDAAVGLPAVRLGVRLAVPVRKVPAINKYTSPRY